MKKLTIHRNQIVSNYLPLKGGDECPDDQCLGDPIFVRPLPDGRYLLVAGYQEYIRSMQEGSNILTVVELETREIDAIFREKGSE